MKKLEPLYTVPETAKILKVSEKTRWGTEAASMANHASTRTTQLYDRRRDELSPR